MAPHPVRVLLIAPSLDILGGQSVQADCLYQGLRADPAVAMTFLPNNPRAPGLLRPLQRIKFVRTVVTFCVFLAKLCGAAPRCDVLHIFTAGYSSYLLWTVPSLFMARLFGKKTIVNYHDGQCEDHLRNWRSAIPTLRLADSIVTPSDFLVDVLGKFGLAARSIFNVIEVDRFHYRPRAALGPRFMTNRGLEPHYNVDCVLRGFQLIESRLPAATLTVAHDGPSRAHLEALARQLQLRHVTFLGSVPAKDVPALYDRADVYLTTPNIDNMPLSVLEAFASGVPVISTNVGGVPYILEHERTGLLIPANDPQALAQSAFRLLDDPALVERLTTAARAQCERYRWPAIRGRWIAEYRRVAGIPEPAGAEEN